jgi:hypothetical protein
MGMMGDRTSITSWCSLPMTTLSGSQENLRIFRFL